jgi:hypothetical protein
MSAAHHATVGGPSAGGLAYTVDGQGVVLRVREASRRVTALRRDDRAQPSPQALVSPLTWEPLQRLLAWGAREGMTAAELLDTCRTATRPPATRTPRGRTIGGKAR